MPAESVGNALCGVPALAMRKRCDYLQMLSAAEGGGTPQRAFPTHPQPHDHPFWVLRLRRISCRASPTPPDTAGSLDPLSPHRGRSRRGVLRAPARRVDRSRRTSGNGKGASHAGRVGSRSISSRGTVDIRRCRHRDIARASPSVLDVYYQSGFNRRCIAAMSSASGPLPE
jgi:hypothetical protein